MDSKATKNMALAGLGLTLLLFGWLLLRGDLPFSNKLADPEENAELAEQGAQLSLLLQADLDDRLANSPASENQERLDSPVGQALLRQCLEWTEFYDNHPSEDTLQNREQACAAYADYVKDGKIPE